MDYFDLVVGGISEIENTPGRVIGRREMATGFHGYTIRSYACTGGYRATIQKVDSSVGWDQTVQRNPTGVLGVYATEEKAIEAGRDCILIGELNKAA